ncbi:DUF6158 family protein [Luedemannella helvata]
MTELEMLLDEVFVGQERLTRDELRRRAVASNVGSETAMAIDGLPEGEYTIDEVQAVISLGRGLPAATDGGIPAEQLDELDLRRELEQLHRTRNDTFLHGSDQALQRHTERTAELEAEYLRRHPEREVDEDRLRSGARSRDGQPA